MHIGVGAPQPLVQGGVVGGYPGRQLAAFPEALDREGEGRIKAGLGRLPFSGRAWSRAAEVHRQAEAPGYARFEIEAEAHVPLPPLGEGQAKPQTGAAPLAIEALVLQHQPIGLAAAVPFTPGRPHHAPHLEDVAEVAVEAEAERHPQRQGLEAGEAELLQAAVGGDQCAPLQVH